MAVREGTLGNSPTNHRLFEEGDRDPITSFVIMAGGGGAPRQSLACREKGLLGLETQSQR